MRNSIFPIIFFLFISCQSLTRKEYEPIRIEGSESLHELFKELKNDFEKIQDTLAIELEGGGSRIGLSAIIGRTADIGLSSYEFNLVMSLI